MLKSKDDVVPSILHAVIKADFIRPSYHLPKDKVEKLFGVGEGAIFTYVSSVVRHGSNYPYLAEHVVQRMFPNHEEKDEAQSLEFIRREVLEGLTLDQLVPAAVHSAAVTAAKACGDYVNDDATIVPPRFLLDEITRGRFVNKSYGEKMHETKLKPLMTLPGHPWYLGD